MIQNLLQLDAACRHENVDTDLYDLSELEQKSWDYSLPTLVTEENVFLKNKLKSTSLSSFSKSFFEKYPATKKFNWNNILIAGGSVGKLIFGNETNDVDIFVYGLNEEEATVKVDEICESIISYYKELEIEEQNKQVFGQKPTRKVRDISEEELGLEYIRNKRTVTIKHNHYETFQIIFRAYRTKSEILHGFDLGSSAIGFAGERVWLTSLGRFAYEYGCNIVDTTRRSTTYEHRLRKYLQRGFEIIMPNLDINLLSTNLWETYELPEVCELPYFVFTYRGRVGNKILLYKFYQRKYEPTSDYDDQSEFNEYSTFFLNIKRLLNGESNNIVYSGDAYAKVLHNAKCFSSARIDYFYDQLERKIRERNFPSSAVENYMSLYDPNFVFANRNNPGKISEMITALKEHVKKLSENLDTQIQWLTENPGTQLTSSFNPIFEDPREWYGKYWKN